MTWKKRSEMPYTCAFMKEVFRFRTLVPFALQHYTNEDAEIGEYFVRTFLTMLISFLKNVLYYVSPLYVIFFLVYSQKFGKSNFTTFLFSKNS